MPEPIIIALSALGGVIILLIIRVPIGLALAGAGFAGLIALRGWDGAFAINGSLPFEFAASWTLSALPLFLLMGSVAFHSGLTSGLFQAARLWLGSLPGGLAVATNFASAAFAAASGSSVATAAAIGRLAIPEMLALKYNPGLATGVVAAAGTLGVMIPPSILFVLYGWIMELPIGQLLIAGIVPGLLTAFVYAVMIIVRCYYSPELAPLPAKKALWSEKVSSLRGIWPILLTIIAVISGIYSGLATATEIAALGAAVSIIIAASLGRFNRKVITSSFRESTAATANVLLIAIGAALFTRFAALAGLPNYLSELIVELNLSPWELIAIIIVVFLILGCFIDAIGSMFLVIPILAPILQAANIDLIWFGVLVVKLLEIGMMTPPFGILAFVAKAAAGPSVPLSTVFRGLLWFLGAEVLIVGLLLGFPSLSVWLPSQLTP